HLLLRRSAGLLRPPSFPTRRSSDLANSARLYHLFGRDDARLRRALRRIDLERLREGSTLVFNQLVGAVKGPWRLKYLLGPGPGRFDPVAHLARPHAERGARPAGQMGGGGG